MAGKYEMMGWHAKVYYRSEKVGLVVVEHDIDELEELQDLVERGPNYYAIDHIEIRRYPIDEETETLTIEEAARQ